jgi:hypothetical protein
MTVAELITQLQKCDQSALVTVELANITEFFSGGITHIDAGLATVAICADEGEGLD